VRDNGDSFLRFDRRGLRLRRDGEEDDDGLDGEQILRLMSCDWRCADGVDSVDCTVRRFCTRQRSISEKRRLRRLYRVGVGALDRR